MEFSEPVVSYMASVATEGKPGVSIPLAFLGFIALTAQWTLYEKCGKPGVACIVPVWNFMVFLEIIGRPAWHMMYLLIPGYNIYFMIRLYVELCRCFGKNSLPDFLFVILLNGFYVLYLALSYDFVYRGPVYPSSRFQPEQQLA